MHKRSGGSSGGPARIARLAAKQHGLITRQQALAAGCSDKVMAGLRRRGVIESVRRGVARFVAVEPTGDQRVLAACLATSGAVACSVTAMALYGFSVRATPKQRRSVHVVAPFGRDQPRQGGVQVHRTRRLESAERRFIRGIPVTSPVRTLKDVAGVIGAGELEEFVGYLISTKRVTIRELAKLRLELASRAGSCRRGSARLRRVLEQNGVTEDADGVFEAEVIRLLSKAGLPPFVRQHRICDRRGRFIAQVDLALVPWRIAIEADGFGSHSSLLAFRNDRLRANRLVLEGWIVLRVSWRDLEDGLTELIAQLKQLIAERPVGSPDGFGLGSVAGPVTGGAGSAPALDRLDSCGRTSAPSRDTRTSSQERVHARNSARRRTRSYVRQSVKSPATARGPDPGRRLRARDRPDLGHG